MGLQQQKGRAELLDTALLESPFIDERTAARIEQFLKTRQGIDNGTGQLEYCFVSGSLLGSWETSVAVNVKRQRWRAVNAPRSAVERPDRKGRVSAVVEDCPPYVTIEGSVHKAIMGHNVYGGPLDPLAASRWFVADVARRLGLALPDADEWEYARIDWTRLFDLGSFEACEQYIHGLRLAEYPRRKPRPFGDESIMWPGTMTSPKIYHKGPEFGVHDFTRLSRFSREAAQFQVRPVPSTDGNLSILEEVKAAVPFDVAVIQGLANRYLRFEVTVKAKKLKAEFGGKPSIVQVTREWLETLHDVETARILSEGKAGMETARKHHEVNARLHEVYDGSLANTLFGTWMQLAAMGEKQVKKHVPRTTFYRQVAQLREAGVTWDAADVYIRENSAIPAGFSMSRHSPFRLLQEAPEVVQALAPFRQAA